MRPTTLVTLLLLPLSLAAAIPDADKDAAALANALEEIKLQGDRAAPARTTGKKRPRPREVREAAVLKVPLFIAWEEKPAPVTNEEWNTHPGPDSEAWEKHHFGDHLPDQYPGGYDIKSQPTYDPSKNAERDSVKHPSFMVWKGWWYTNQPPCAPGGGCRKCQGDGLCVLTWNKEGEKETPWKRLRAARKRWQAGREQ
ncbi:hypothetical protein Q8F55_009211 [Vanrija albida]|uniref:Uncharacterized protein n=1 Tax=Vanrija albida TaxID=181172 RepID=A0ABR3PTA4_9TREE